jgi:hypothetical protein
VHDTNDLTTSKSTCMAILSLKRKDEEDIEDVGIPGKNF